MKGFKDIQLKNGSSQSQFQELRPESGLDWLVAWHIRSTAEGGGRTSRFLDVAPMARAYRRTVHYGRFINS